MMSTEGELDVEVSNEREEGELENSDVEEGTYIPLQRPETFNPPSLTLSHMQIQDEQSDDASAPESSGSDSDEEIRRRTKRAKIRPIRTQVQDQNDKRSKYNIWSKALQEELLTEDMVSCDVTKKTEYGVESYDYTIKYRLDDDHVPRDFAHNRDNSNKRRYQNKKSVTLRLGKRRNSSERSDPKQVPRFLEDLVTTIDDAVEDVAKDVATKLSEEKLDLLLRIVQVLGASKAIEIYKETQRIEADGGMLIMNGMRRRTPGGIYFFLLKRDDEISQEMINKIFNEDKKETARRVKRARLKSRQKVMEELKQSLTDSELPSLLSRGEATVSGAEHGSNPPPSPATDARDYSSDTDAQADPDPPSTATSTATTADRDARHTQSYDDDDFLEINCNDEMEMF